MKFLAIFAITSAALPSALAFCCGSPFGGRCDDGTGGTPCCATSACNIFCCDCGGHCRGRNGKRGLPATFDHDTVEAFTLADKDASGNITLTQYLEYMGVEGQPEIYVNYFYRHDKNNDGVITPNEVNL